MNGRKATVHAVARVRHDLVTKLPPQASIYAKYELIQELKMM